MKKYFFWAASAALVMSSCSNDVEEATVASLNNREIKVTTYTPGMTRATVADNKDVQEKGFWMYAVTDGSELINTAYAYTTNEKGESSWNPSNGTEYMWPETSVDFYGIYDPTMEGALEIGDGIVYFSGLGEKDIMIATSKGRSLSDQFGQNVGLAFQHILADIEVQVKGVKEGYTYTVNSLSLSAKTGFSYTLSSGTYGLDDDTEEISLLDAAKSVETAYIKINDKMVAPGLASLKISYTIKSGNEVVSNVTDRVVSITEAGTQTSYSFEAGKKYILQLSLTPGQLPIKVTTSVEPWGEPVTLPEINLTNETENDPAMQ